MKYLFGPVASRRFNLSLGVDLIPLKTCTFNCIYCELGTMSKPVCRLRPYVSVPAIMAELKDFFQDDNNRADYITLAGSGEPSLNTSTGDIIRSINAEYDVPVAVLTNASLMTFKTVRKRLSLAQVVSPSLDAVTPKIFNRINRPYPGCNIDGIIKGLISFRQEYKGKLWLEIMFVDGINDSSDEIDKLLWACGLIAPDEIHLNTVVRPPCESWARPISMDRMLELKAIFGPSARIPFNIKNLSVQGKDTKSQKDMILNMLKRRPCTINEISSAFALLPKDVKNIITSLVNDSLVGSKIYDGLEFYKTI